jgi:hypothetical protein
MPARSGTARWSSLAAAALVAFAAACGDPENTRTFRLAASGTQLLVSGPSVGFRLTEANLAMDVVYRRWQEAHTRPLAAN